MITVIKGGCGTKHPRAFQLSRPDGVPNFVLLVLRSSGAFRVGSANFSMQPLQAILLSPDTPYSYGNPHGNYINDWLHFEMSDVHFRKRLFSLSNQPLHVENHHILSFCIGQLIWELSYGQPDLSPENTHALFTLLFNHLLHSNRRTEGRRNPDMLQQKLQRLRLEIGSTVYENHSIKTHAQRLSISESYFQSRYKALFGISFQRDFIQMRVDYAKNLLVSTDMPMDQVSEACGYTNAVHFYRQFKKQTDMTPAKFRKRNESEG